MENNDIHKELQNLNSPLAKMENKNPFEVPANYFEEMPPAIQNHIYDRKKMLPVFALPNFWIRLAPAFAIILVGIAAYMLSPKNALVQNNNMANNKIEIPIISEQSSNEIMLDEIDEELLVETYTENMKTESKKVVEKKETTVKNAELEEYILENYDENLLIEEL